jgi:S-adenosylmethionine:tRNA ribosyltransferase-isomerase
VLVSDFDYHLPEELIAQHPLPDRAASRMMHQELARSTVKDCRFSQFPDMLRPDDLVILNNTRVFHARLFGTRKGLHSQPVGARNPGAQEFLRGRIEVLLTRMISDEPNDWECLVRPGRKVRVGEQLSFGESNELEAEVIGRGDFGERQLRFSAVPNFLQLLEKIGHVPLPPYIDREGRSEDEERYQTIYAHEPGAVAAPTAGLHFTPEIFARMKARGIQVAEITLHVGIGTFQPLHVTEVERHRMHSEHYSISTETAAVVNEALRSGRRVVAVGTTAVRTLEFAARESSTPEVAAGSGECDLFIYPGFDFRVVGALLTNFHLPQSTLLMLVCAFAGREKVLDAYRHAVLHKYRFYSYGDCMFVER